MDDPADDAATPGDRAPYLDTHVQLSTTGLPVGNPTFAVPPAKR